MTSTVTRAVAGLLLLCAATAGLATLTALGRMEENKHFLSDVIAGATLGLAVGRLVSAGHGDDWSVGVAPGGVTLARSF